MGIIGNLIVAGFVRRHNRRANRVCARLFEFVPDRGNLIVCGGRTDGEAATRIKEDIFYSCIADSLNNGSKHRGPCLAICSPNSVSSDLHEDLVALAENNEPVPIVYFGVNTQYIPFDNTASPEQVIGMFSRIIKRRYGEPEAISRDIEALLMKLIFLLYDGLGQSRFTYDNLSIIIDNLVETPGSRNSRIQVKGLRQFLDWIELNLGIATGGFSENLFINSWAVVVTKFYEFWNQYVAQISRLSNCNGKRRSLFSCLSKGEVCLLEISGTYGELLLETVINELEFFTEQSRSTCNLVSIHESMSHFKDYRVLDEVRSVLIGNTFAGLDLMECNIPDPTVVCLGVSSKDAKDIFELMVSSGNWLDMHFGIAQRSGHTGLSIVQKEPIATAELTLGRIHDGGAFIISPEGYSRINHLCT